MLTKVLSGLSPGKTPEDLDSNGCPGSAASSWMALGKTLSLFGALFSHLYNKDFELVGSHQLCDLLTAWPCSSQNLSIWLASADE